MRLADHGPLRSYPRLCLRVQHLEEIYRLLSQDDERCNFIYGKYDIESISDFRDIIEMPICPSSIYAYNGDMRLSIHPWNAELDSFKYRHNTSKNSNTLLKIDNILRS